MTSNEKMNNTSTHKKLSVVLITVASLSGVASVAHSAECGNGAQIVAAKEQAIIQTAERRQKVVEAVKDEVLSVQESCNEIIKMLPHDLVATAGRFIGIAPPITQRVQSFTIKKATSFCRKQINVVNATINKAKDSALKKVSDATGIKTGSLRKLAEEGLTEGAFSEDTILDAISTNSNINRDIRKDINDTLQAIEIGEQLVKDIKTDLDALGITTPSAPQPQPLTPSALATAPNAPPPTQVKPAQTPQSAPRQGSGLSASPSKDDASIMDRLRGLF